MSNSRVGICIAKHVMNIVNSMPFIVYCSK